MLKLIKGVLLNTLIVFLAEFVALILLGTLVYVKILSPEYFFTCLAFIFLPVSF